MVDEVDDESEASEGYIFKETTVPHLVRSAQVTGMRDTAHLNSV